MTEVVVAGAGVAGLACAFHLLRDGHRVTILDRDPEGDRASHGNAGGIAVPEIIPASAPGLWKRVPGWLVDPLGPLALRPSRLPALAPWLLAFMRAGRPRVVEASARALAALNARVCDDLTPMLEAIGLAGDLHKVGALCVYESDAGLARDAGEWALRERFGVTFERISGDEARKREPALGPRVRHGVILPAWSHVADPKRIVTALRDWARDRGAAIVAGEAVDIEASAVVLASGARLEFEACVIAAGAWSARLARRIGERALITSERGYNTTLPAPGVALSREIIFAERKFVATPLAMGLRIGGAAEFAGLEARPNYARAGALLSLAKLYLPGLRPEGGAAWMGHRPATPDSLPILGRSARRANVFYACGHGHLGLTQAATTGALIADIIAARAPALDMAPFSISRFRSPS
jgi:D-amino-acid dehydrogenase